MRTQPIIATYIFALLILLSGNVLAQHPPLNVVNFGVGDNAFPTLQAWSGVDKVKAHFYSSVANGGKTDNAFFYNTTCTPGPVNCGSSALNGVAHTDNQYPVYGGWLYGEAGTSATPASAVWGAKLVGVAWGSTATVHGAEVNGVNLGTGTPSVDGVFVVMGGNAKTRAAVAIATSIAAPSGRPDYGIILAGPNSQYSTANPASVTGLYIDNITSGEAIRIQANQRIALTKAQTTYFRYDSASDKVQLVKNNVIVAQW